MKPMDLEIDSNKHIDKILLRRIRILVIVLVVMTGALVYEVYISHIDEYLLILGILLGIIVGIIAGRMFYLEWHKEKSKVIARLDRFGVVVLAAYIIFSLARHWIFKQWFNGATLSAFTISFIEGAMIGRIVSFRFHIKRVLTEQGKI
jgi:uncharacterized integral membrane protein